MQHFKTYLTFAYITCAVAFTGFLTQSSQAAEKKDPTADWKTVFTDAEKTGGHRRFTLKKDSTVAFVWDVTASHAAANFRITIGKQESRTGKFHTMGVIVREHKSTNGSKKAKLKAGQYQLYIAVKRVEYTVSVKAEKTE